MRYLSLIMIAACLAACQGDKKASKPAVAETATQTYPAIPQDIMQRIYTETTGFDALFNKLPVTISQVNPEDANVHAGFIGPAEVPKNHGCTADANMLFHNQDGILADLHYFFTGGCNYILLLEKGKPAYGGVLTAEGLKFYNNIILQAQQQARQQLQGK